MATAKKTLPAHYLVRYTMHDGEHEYRLQFITLSGEMADVVAELTGFEGQKLDEAVKILDDGGWAEIKDDYRMIDEVYGNRISPEDEAVLNKYGIW